MGRTTWVKPMTLVQKFEANEPVAADTQCWYVACEYKWGAPGLGGDGLEAHTDCHDASNQVLIDNTGDGIPDIMKEVNHNVECILYSDSSYNNRINPSDIDPTSGATIYWISYLGVPYHHHGTIQQASTDHPNRS